jgi:hypothetical protein
MKQLLISLLAFLAISAWATPSHHMHRGHSNSNWVAPLVFGGIIGYAISQNQAQANTPVMAPAPCPISYTLVTERVWIQDSYGRFIQVDRIVGCR